MKIDTIVEEIVKERADFLAREALRNFLNMPVSKLIRHCAATRLAKALSEDPVIVRLNEARNAFLREEISRRDFERTVRRIQAELGSGTLRPSRVPPR